MTEEFYIGQIFKDEYPVEAADWCNSNGKTIVEIEQENGVRRFEIQELPLPTKEEISALREQLYIKDADPITCHINRLKDEEQTPEIIAEIETLKAERATVIAKIKEENPYPEE